MGTADICWSFWWFLFFSLSHIYQFPYFLFLFLPYFLSISPFLLLYSSLSLFFSLSLSFSLSFSLVGPYTQPWFLFRNRHTNTDAQTTDSLLSGEPCLSLRTALWHLSWRVNTFCWYIYEVGQRPTPLNLPAGRRSSKGETVSTDSFTALLFYVFGSSDQQRNYKNKRSLQMFLGICQWSADEIYTHTHTTSI